MGDLRNRVVSTKRRRQALDESFPSFSPPLTLEGCDLGGRQLLLTKAICREDAVISHEWPTFVAAVAMHAWVLTGDLCVIPPHPTLATEVGVAIHTQDIRHSHLGRKAKGVTLVLQG